MKYEIKGAPMSVVICSLENGETIRTQSGAMSWMSANMKMATSSGGGIGKMFSRAINGESLFVNEYTAEGGSGELACSATFPGQILAVPVSASKTIVAQGSAFLACEKNVDMSIFFQKKLGSGLFGGEGFIMEKFTGEGMVFLEIDGSVVEYELAQGETKIINTGYLAAMDETVSIDVEMLKGLGNMLFGGESLFNTKVTGPGHVWLQTMPIAGVAAALKPFFPTPKVN